jgi:hypothetical protein
VGWRGVGGRPLSQESDHTRDACVHPPKPRNPLGQPWEGLLLPHPALSHGSGYGPVAKAGDRKVAIVVHDPHSPIGGPSTDKRDVRLLF